MNKSCMEFILADVVQEILDNNVDALFDVIQRAYIAHDSGKTVVPGSQFLKFPNEADTRIISLPAHINDDKPITGIKWIGSNPQNKEEGLPRASAVIILNDPKTKRPTVCMEGALISAARTAISAVLAARYLVSNNRFCENLGIIGNGPIGLNILKAFVKDGWKIKNISLFDLNLSTSKSFAYKIVDVYGHQNIPNIQVETGCDALVQRSDLIVCATTAVSPYLHNFSWFGHAPTVLNVSLRDIAPEIISESFNIVDDIENVLHANTSIHLAQQKYDHIDYINGTLGQVVMDKTPISSDFARPRIFSPMGLGILDIVIADYVYLAAKKNNCCVTMDNFLSVAE